MSNKKVRLIERALAYHNRGRAFFTNVKCGPTIFAPVGELKIVDAISIKRSWSKPCITIYEIKISKSDFNRDEKWHSYLPFCHKFFFVCPTGLIKTDEVANPAGLIIVGGKGCRVIKNVPLRPVEEISWPLLYYLVISRLDDDAIEIKKENYWKNWVEGKKEFRSLGYIVGKSINKKLNELIEKDEKLRNREYEVRQLEEDKEEILKILSPLDYPQYQWKHKLKEIVADKLTNMSILQIEEAINHLDNAKKSLKQSYKE